MSKSVSKKEAKATRAVGPNGRNGQAPASGGQAMREARVAYRVHVPAEDVLVPVREGESEEDALNRASKESPALSARAARTTAQRADGKRTGKRLDEVFTGHGIDRTESGVRGQKGTPNGSIPLRVPVSVHHDLVERARREGVSVNQLVLSFIGRGLGFRASA